jgi:hypothetical protein
VAGTFDILAGLTRIVGGILSWKWGNVAEGARDVGLGALKVLGLKEVLTEKYVHSSGAGGAPTTEMAMPATLVADIKDTKKDIPEDAGRNGFHAWHAANSAVVTNRLGALGAVGVWIAGVVHETPLDKQSFRDEQKAQGTVNHILDSTGDIFANTLGIALGLLLPRAVAIKVAAFLGNYIPGPADPTSPPGFGKSWGKPYMGDPWVNWRHQP